MRIHKSEGPGLGSAGIAKGLTPFQWLTKGRMKSLDLLDRATAA